jgi:hypothetical protein
MVVHKISKGILMCWVLHIVAFAEDAAVSTNKSINMELDSAVSNSKASSGEVNVTAFIATNKDKHDAEMKESPREMSLESARSNSTSNDTEKSTESDKKESVHFKTEDEEEDPLDRVYRECNGRLYCIEQRVIGLIDRLDAVKSIPMFEGYITIEKTSEEVPAKDVIADSDAALLSRVDRYLTSHSIRVHTPETEGEVLQLPGRFFQEKFFDFNLGTLATNDASEG